MQPTQKIELQVGDILEWNHEFNGNKLQYKITKVTDKSFWYEGGLSKKSFGALARYKKFPGFKIIRNQ